MHQHISCGAPIFLWRDNVGEHSEQLGALGATRSNSDYRLNSLTP